MLTTSPLNQAVGPRRRTEIEYVIITNNNPNGVFIMTQYGDNAVSVHTETNYIIWVWHNATNDQVSTVADSVETISVVFING